jgi:hypothetical protein
MQEGVRSAQDWSRCQTRRWGAEIRWTASSGYTASGKRLGRRPGRQSGYWPGKRSGRWPDDSTG